MLELAKEYTELQQAMKYAYQGRCPNPKHKDSDPSFTVWTDSNSWACLGCHHGKKNDKHKIYGSDCIAFIQWIKKMSWRESVLYLAKKYNIPLPDNKNEKILYNKKMLAYSYMLNLKGRPLEYILNRGLSEDDCFEWGIGYDGNRITFPLFDRYENVLGFSKRRLDDNNEEAKYKNSINSSVFNKGMYLYGLNKIDNDFEEIRVTEGQLDVILSNKYKAKNIVATLGTAFTDKHVEIIKHYKKTPVFCMDSDESGIKSMNKNIELLAEQGIYSKVLILPNGYDMADMANKMKYDLEDYIQKNSITYGYYLINKQLSVYQSKLNELKLNMYPELLKVLEKVPNKDEKNILKSYIKNIMQIEM